MPGKKTATLTAACVLSAAIGAGATTLFLQSDTSPEPDRTGVAIAFTQSLGQLSPGKDTEHWSRYVEPYVAPGTGWRHDSPQAQRLGKAVSDANQEESDEFPGSGFVTVTHGQHLGRPIYIYSVASRRPIIAVAVVHIQDKGWFVDWNATAKANEKPLPPYPSGR